MGFVAARLLLSNVMHISTLPGTLNTFPAGDICNASALRSCSRSDINVCPLSAALLLSVLIFLSLPP